MENPTPTPTPEPALNFDHYITRDSYSKTTFIQNTELLSMAMELHPYIPEELHRNTVRDFMKKLDNVWGVRKIARTSHAQMTAIFSKHLAAILTAKEADRKTKPGDLEEFQKRVESALKQARLVDKECSRRADEERRIAMGGNIEYVTVPKKKKVR